MEDFDEDSLVYIARYFNRDFISVSNLRNRQDGKFVTKIRKKSLEIMGGEGIRLEEKGLFYVGSVDFMVARKDGERNFVVLETNGGSGRGLLSLTSGQTELIFSGYKGAIDQNCDLDDGEKKFILIGALPNDALFQEKIMLVEYLKKRFKMEGYKSSVYNTFTFNPSNIGEEEDIIFILSNYNNINEHLSYRNNHMTFKGKEIDVVIGDGVARRFPIIGAHVKRDWKKLETIIVNPVYQISDDKANTYLAVEKGYDRLKKYRIDRLEFARINDPFNLERRIEDILTRASKNYILKPFGGSGGVGIQPIIPPGSRENAEEIIEKSITEYYQKFDSRRNIFPYTIQEMANFEIIEWNNSKRTFDVRIYLVQKDGKLIPAGGEGRIAPLPYKGNYEKEEFVVNLTGYGGVEIERAIAFSEKGLKTLNLQEEDLIDMFCAACETFNAITQNFTDIVNFKHWDSLKLEGNI
ncbi:MAG: hypothetical protein ACFFCS_03095 [Candidatus Hodarchaeota archaeon]